jgi:hypothetical protein
MDGRRSEGNIKIEIKEMGCELCRFLETHYHSANEKLSFMKPETVLQI